MDFFGYFLILFMTLGTGVVVAGCVVMAIWDHYVTRKQNDQVIVGFDGSSPDDAIVVMSVVDGTAVVVPPSRRYPSDGTPPIVPPPRPHD
jgi:hypothetical protein